MTRPSTRMLGFMLLAACCFGAALALFTRNQLDDAFAMAVIALLAAAAGSGR
jgi:hypothetical protein